MVCATNVSPAGYDVAFKCHDAGQEPARRVTTQRHHIASQHSEEPMGELIDKAKGKIKQAAGAATGNKKLEREGRVDTAKGNAKGAFEKAKQAVKDAAKK